MLLRTFGGLVLDDADFTRPKPLLLLTYLALEGHQDRRFVAELFWPEAKDHMKSLTVALARLRKSVPSVIGADRKRAWATVDIDAVQFLTLLERGKLEKALELYQGPFLEGFYLKNWGVELEEWVYKTREFLAGRARGALLELAEREAAQGPFDQAAKRAETAHMLAGAPALEPEELIRLYTLLRAGNNPRAAEVRAEAEGFGVETVASTDEARERLRQSFKVPAVSTPHNLPARGTAFIGRDLELAEVATLLLQSDRSLLTLVGPPGVGKTRVAVQVSQEQLTLGSFTDGIYLAPLESLTSARFIPTAIANALEFDLQGSSEPLKQVMAHIGEQEMLLLLDNFEHLMDGAETLADLVKACPNLKLLVTSRERLNLEEEHIFPVTGMPFPKGDRLTLEEAERFDAVRLFMRRAKRARPDFELTEGILPHVLRICRLVEGLPLGLELAAVWVRVMSPHDIASEIETGLDLLTTVIRNLPERHQSIRAAFEQSWKLLSPKEQAVLRKLSVFRGGFRREAASEVAGATVPVLASLLDKSLLRMDQTSRYDRHPLLYGYTREKLAKHPEEQAETGGRHAAYFLRLAEEFRPKLHRPGEESEIDALKTLAVEHENLRAALNWSLESGSSLALQLAGALRTFWEIGGHLAEACHWLEVALAAPAEDVPPRTRFAAHSAYGRFLLLRGQMDCATGQFDAALELSRVTGHLRDEAEALNHSGLLALERRDNRRAESLCAQALELHRSHGNKRGVAVTLNNLGNIARCRHDRVKAAAFFEESLALHRELGIRRSEAIALGNLGFVARHQGEITRAAKLLGESLTIRHELGDKIGLAHSFLGLAGLMCELGDCERAATLLGVTDRLLEATSVALALADRSDYDQTVASTRAQLCEEEFEGSWARGYALSIDCAVTDTLELQRCVCES